MNTQNKPSFENWKRNIILFLGSQTISLFGSSLVQYAIMWYITLETQSGIMMTLYIICGFLPTFILSPFAGVWADRFNRKFLIIFADSMIAISTLILAILFINGFQSIWLLFVISAIRALGSGIQGPAVGAILPQIVPADKLTKANGANGTIQALTMLISPMISGALLSFATIETIFFIDVVTAAIAVFVLLVLLRIPAHEKAQEKQDVSYFTDLKKGFKYIHNHAFLKQYFSYLAIFLFMCAPVSFLTPLQVARSFGDDVWRLTAIEMGFSIGMMIGGALMMTWGGFKNRTKTMTLALYGFSFSTLGLGIIPNFWIYVALMGVAGISMPIMNTPITTLFQEKVDPDYLGRVFGVMTMLATSMMPLGMLVFGPFSDKVDIEWILIGTGIFMLVITFFLAKNKVLIEAGEPTVTVEKPAN